MTKAGASSKKPRGSLKDRLQKPGGITAADAMERGQEALGEMRGDYLAELTQEIARLARLLKSKPRVYSPKEEWWAEVRKRLTDMRNVAGSYDYALVTVLCDNLLDDMDHVPEDEDFAELFGQHITVLQRVANNDVRGKGGPEERDLLKALRSKVKARKTKAANAGSEDGDEGS